MASNFQHSPADVLRRVLVTLGLGINPKSTTNYTTSEWPVHYRAEPDRPDNCITTYNTQGRMDGRTSDGEQTYHFGFQIRIRSIDEVLAQIKAAEIAEAIDALYRYRITIGDITYCLHCLSRTGQILDSSEGSTAKGRMLKFINGVGKLYQLS